MGNEASGVGALRAPFDEPARRASGAGQWFDEGRLDTQDLRGEIFLFAFASPRHAAAYTPRWRLEVSTKDVRRSPDYEREGPWRGVIAVRSGLGKIHPRLPRCRDQTGIAPILHKEIPARRPAKSAVHGGARSCGARAECLTLFSLSGC